MSGFGHKYVVDTNTLTQIGTRRRASAFFQESVVLPEEVLWEAREFPDIDALRTLIYPTTSDVLDHLRRVMSTVAVEDTSLVNLYSNKGGADPMLIACALDGQERDSVFLYAPEWVVVTGDDAVRRSAVRLGLTSLSNAEFAARIDASEPPPDHDEFDALPHAEDPGSRTCPQCGAHCAPESFEPEDGFRVAFVCPTQRVHTVVPHLWQLDGHGHLQSTLDPSEGELEW